jgi:hypothetical protein
MAGATAGLTVLSQPAQHVFPARCCTTQSCFCEPAKRENIFGLYGSCRTGERGDMFQKNNPLFSGGEVVGA